MKRNILQRVIVPLEKQNTFYRKMNNLRSFLIVFDS